jgi:hypothetical protein
MPDPFDYTPPKVGGLRGYGEVGMRLGSAPF